MHFIYEIFNQHECNDAKALTFCTGVFKVLYFNWGVNALGPSGGGRATGGQRRVAQSGAGRVLLGMGGGGRPSAGCCATGTLCAALSGGIPSLTSRSPLQHQKCATNSLRTNPG